MWPRFSLLDHQRSWKRAVLFRLFLLGPILCSPGCQRKGQEAELSINAEPSKLRQINLIIPDRFVGALKIVKNPERGATIDRRGDIEIAFSADGVYAMNDFGELTEPHFLSAQYASGKMLKIDPEGDLESGEIALWSIGSFRGTKYPQETLIYLVCTKEDKQSFSSNLR